MTAGKGPWPAALPTDGIDHHYFAGYLWSTAKRGESITPEVWNTAVLAARAFAEQMEAERAARAETAKRNAIAARRRGQADRG